MDRTKILRRLFVIAVAIILVSANALASVEAVINTSGAKIYKSASTASASVSAVAGITVTVTDYSGSWAKISYKGKTGYIKIGNLNLKDRIEAYIYKDTGLYAKASASSNKIASMSVGTKVYIVSISGDYAAVQNKSGSVTGYVKTDDLASHSQMESAYTSASGYTSAEKAAALAVSFIGKPYGKEAPLSFNCSSLIKYCYGKCGISTKSSASAIANDSGMEKITSFSSCRTGDILCFDQDGDGTCDHVAIYISGNRFVEASQSAGKVQYNTMSSWYKSHCLWARRP